LSLRVLQKNGHFIILGFEKDDFSSSELISEKEYNEIIFSVKNILKGKFSKSKALLKKQMLEHSNLEEFEKADECKNKLKALENYQSKSMVVSSKIKDLDIYSIISDEKYAYVNFTQISNGFIISSFNTHIKKSSIDDDKKILEQLIPQIKVKFASDSKEVCSNIQVDTMDYKKIVIPVLGDKKHLVDMSIRNVKNYKINFFKSKSLSKVENSSNRILMNLKKVLNMDSLPTHIECFDNSNFQGSFPSSACVVLEMESHQKKTTDILI